MSNNLKLAGEIALVTLAIGAGAYCLHLENKRRKLRINSTEFQALKSVAVLNANARANVKTTTKKKKVA